MSNRSGQPGINSKEYASLKVNWPLKYEQNKISNFLSLIDQRIITQRKLIENYKSLIKMVYTRIISFENVKFNSINSLIKQGLVRIVKSFELPKFSGTKIYLSTSSIVNTTIVTDEGFIIYENRPNRATMFPFKESVWFAKMKNTIKVLLADEYNEKIIDLV